MNKLLKFIAIFMVLNTGLLIYVAVLVKKSVVVYTPVPIETTNGGVGGTTGGFGNEPAKAHGIQQSGAGGGIESTNAGVNADKPPAK